MRNAGCEVAFDDTTNETCIWMTWVCHAMLVVQQWWWWHRGWRPRWRWRVRQRSGRLYKQDIRSLSNATFSFGTSATWLSSSSKSAAVDKISSKSDDFSLRYGDVSIFKMEAVRHFGIVLPPYETTHEVCCWLQLPVKYDVNLIHRSEDIAIWIFRIFGLKCLFRPQKWGFWGSLYP